MSNRLLDSSSLFQKGKSTGPISVLPLVNTGKIPKGPNKQFVLRVPFGEIEQFDVDAQNAVSVEMQQLVVTGITGMSGSGVLALQFEHVSSDTLCAQSEHNLNNISGNSVFFYYSDNTEKVGYVNFAGDPITLWQSRGSKDFRHIGRLTLKNVQTGATLGYDHIWLWLVINTNTWQ